MNKSDLPEPFRGGCGHSDEQIGTEGSLLAIMIAIVVLVFAGYGVYALVVKLWTATAPVVGQ